MTNPTGYGPHTPINITSETKRAPMINPTVAETIEALRKEWRHDLTLRHPEAYPQIVAAAAHLERLAAENERMRGALKKAAALADVAGDVFAVEAYAARAIEIGAEIRAALTGDTNVSK